MERLEEQILCILEQDATADAQRISTMLGASPEQIADIIANFTKSGVILRYKALINWEKTEREMVVAHIELRVTPQRGEGFDKIAERIYQYPEIKSVYLVSGGYDLGVTIEGRSMKEVALFVAEKLAPMDNVISTKTHFVLRKYKDDGVIFTEDDVDERKVITL